MHRLRLVALLTASACMVSFGAEHASDGLASPVTEDVRGSAEAPFVSISPDTGEPVAPEEPTDVPFERPWWHFEPVIRFFRMPLRGFGHAVRDLLFPDFRNNPPAVQLAKSSLDRALPEESAEEFAQRIAIRDWFLSKADALGLPALQTRYPSLFRYGMALAVGVLLMVFVVLFQLAAQVAARVCLKSMLRLTRSDVFVDEEDQAEIDLYARYEAEAGAKAAAKQAAVAKKRDGATSVAEHAASSGESSAAPAASTTVGRRNSEEAPASGSRPGGGARKRARPS